MNTIAKNIARIRERIAAAAERAGRKASEITLLAVSKTKPAEMIAEAFSAGQLNFGENYVQELIEKQDLLNRRENEPVGIKWHMIGHVQTNKVKKLVGRTELIHSVDSLRLAAEIQRCAESAGVIVNILLEVNVAKEDSKYGFMVEDTIGAIKKMDTFTNIRVFGLMTSAPYTIESEKNRQYFRELRELYLDIKRLDIHNTNMCVLSMGMSGDFETAVEEGATMVRIGTSVFGARNFGPV